MRGGVPCSPPSLTPSRTPPPSQAWPWPLAGLPCPHTPPPSVPSSGHTGSERAGGLGPQTQPSVPRLGPQEAQGRGLCRCTCLSYLNLRRQLMHSNKQVGAPARRRRMMLRRGREKHPVRLSSLAPCAHPRASHGHLESRWIM